VPPASGRSDRETDLRVDEGTDGMFGVQGPDRVAVVGTSCAGKTTLARSLSRALSVPHIELDALYWGPDWTPRPTSEFRSRVEDAVEGSTWVIDGNYSIVRDLVWRNAATLIWLNYSFPLVFSRAVSRTLRRSLSGERLFSGNQESLRGVLDPDWIPWWVVRTFRRRRREYRTLLEQPEYAHLRVVELQRPEETARFLGTRVT